MFVCVCQYIFDSHMNTLSRAQQQQTATNNSLSLRACDGCHLVLWLTNMALACQYKHITIIKNIYIHTIIHTYIHSVGKRDKTRTFCTSAYKNPSYMRLNAATTGQNRTK